MKTKLIEWSKKVSENKKELDKMMFDDLMKNVLAKIELESWEHAQKYVRKNSKAKGSNMRGPHLLGVNSEIIYNKMWSLERKEKKKGDNKK